MTRDIRELAQRAELEFHQRPHRFRRRAWWSGVVLALICGAWLVWSAVIADYRVYEAGPLSTAHAFIANDCRQCHTSWQPLRRLATLGSHATSVNTSSISNAACIKCHTADEHQPHQIPAHASLSCAECHREHRGKMELASVSDQHCVRCHADLRTTSGPSRRFTQQIRGFSGADGHPEFNILRRLQSPQTVSNLLTGAELEALQQASPTEAAYQARFLDVLTERATVGGTAGTAAKWRDRGKIQFNHAAHLGPQGVRDKTGQIVHLAQNCQACHVPDEAGRYMQPINYRQHCAQCHPLWYDNQNYPGDEVPHDTPEIVRGYLTQKYTLTVLKQSKPLATTSPTRPLPGLPDPAPISADQARRLDELVAQGQQMAQDYTRVLKSKGGCKLCHSVTESSAATTDLKINWSILPTQIPHRWLPHSRFDHNVHRMLNCQSCHADVAKRRDTADVMLPGIADCRDCHVSETGWPAGGTATSRHQVRSSCVLCHTYHRRTAPEKSGTLNRHLTPEPGK